MGRCLHTCRLMLAQHHLGDALHAGSLRRLTNVVALDQRLNWLGFLPVLREAALLYKSEVRCHRTCAHTYIHTNPHTQHRCARKKTYIPKVLTHAQAMHEQAHTELRQGVICAVALD